jgi:hypothetical protein
MSFSVPSTLEDYAENYDDCTNKQQKSAKAIGLFLLTIPCALNRIKPVTKSTKPTIGKTPVITNIQSIKFLDPYLRLIISGSGNLASDGFCC